MGTRRTGTTPSPGFVQDMQLVSGGSLAMRSVQMEHYLIQLREFVIWRKTSSAHKTME